MTDTTSASALAHAQGSRVEVLDQRTETRDVFANPDGTFTAELRMTPVRARRGTGWVPVDTTLRSRPDGGVEPVATTRSVVPAQYGGQHDLGLLALQSLPDTTPLWLCRDGRGHVHLEPG